TAWEHTKVYQRHAEIFEDGEFIWADSAYPVEIWVVSPYRKPESEEPSNEVYNNHVSMVRIRSEHAIGFLKGRFQSLKGLRVAISDEDTHKYATFWIVACIGLHAFAMKCEDEEKAMGTGTDTSVEDFIRQGLDIQPPSPFSYQPPPHPHRGSAKLAAGKAHREHLKKVLLEAKEHRVLRAFRDMYSDDSASDGDN
ncbi:hypothetical protein CPC08DRAFT_652079, partial [Agrocybe pediades]